MFTGFTADEIQTLKTEKTFAPRQVDFFENGKPRLVVATETDHLLRRTTQYEGRDGRKAWTMQGEWLAFGPRGSVWQSYRYDTQPDLLAWVNVRTFKVETATAAEALSLTSA